MSKSVYQDVSVNSQSSQSSSFYGKFSSKLEKLYKSISHTTEASRSILNRSPPQLNQQDPVAMKVTYDINEYETNNSICFQHEKVNPVNESPKSIETEQHQQNASRLSRGTVRAENEYVIMPTLENNDIEEESEDVNNISDNPKLKIYEVSLLKVMRIFRHG